jgi:hypothetical protein
VWEPVSWAGAVHPPLVRGERQLDVLQPPILIAVHQEIDDNRARVVDNVAMGQKLTFGRRKLRRRVCPSEDA